MGARKLSAVIGLVIVLTYLAGTSLAQTTWTEQDADGETRVHLWFFWAEACPHCQAAHPFVEAIPQERPWVILHALEVSRDRDNAARFAAMAKSIGQHAEAVPTFMVCGTMETGWEENATSGARLLSRLDACRNRRAAPSSGPPAVDAPGAMNIPLFGTIDPTTLSLPFFTLAIASLDAFNPCAFFVLLFLLSLLAHQKDRRRMLMVGGIFVAASGLMYFAFMAAWLNVFQMLGALTWITLAAGILAMVVGAINIKDFFAFAQGPTLSIPESAKPNLYRRARSILQSESGAAMLAATIFLAVAANFYELLCTAGFPMVYTRILTLHEPAVAARYGWLILYNVIYVMPLALIVLAFVGTLAAHKLTEREGRLLKLMSGIMMLELGFVLAFAPAWLNSLAMTMLLVGLALAVTLLAARRMRSAKAQ